MNITGMWRSALFEKPPTGKRLIIAYRESEEDDADIYYAIAMYEDGVLGFDKNGDAVFDKAYWIENEQHGRYDEPQTENVIAWQPLDEIERASK